MWPGQKNFISPLSKPSVKNVSSPFSSQGFFFKAFQITLSERVIKEEAVFNSLQDLELPVSKLRVSNILHEVIWKPSQSEIAAGPLFLLWMLSQTQPLFLYCNVDSEKGEILPQCYPELRGREGCKKLFVVARAAVWEKSRGWRSGFSRQKYFQLFWCH